MHVFHNKKYDVEATLSVFSEPFRACEGSAVLCRRGALVPQLSAAFALSPGGRGQDGSPVITFPDYPAFSDVPDKEFQNVMTYLTSIPRCVSPNPPQLGKGP